MKWSSAKICEENDTQVCWVTPSLRGPTSHGHPTSTSRPLPRPPLLDPKVTSPRRSDGPSLQLVCVDSPHLAFVPWGLPTSPSTTGCSVTASPRGASASSHLLRVQVIGHRCGGGSGSLASKPRWPLTSLRTGRGWWGERGLLARNPQRLHSGALRLRLSPRPVNFPHSSPAV